MLPLNSKVYKPLFLIIKNMLKKIAGYGKKIARGIALPLTLLAAIEGCTAISKPQIIPYQDSYVRVTDKKEEIKTAVFKKGEVEVQLIGVSHFATKEYYSQIEDKLKSADFIVAEGPKNERSFANQLATFPFRGIDYLTKQPKRLNSIFFADLKQQHICLKPKVRQVIADTTTEECQKQIVPWVNDNKSNLLLFAYNLVCLPDGLINLSLMPVGLAYNFADAGISCATIGKEEFINRRRRGLASSNINLAKKLEETRFHVGERNKGYRIIIRDRDKFVLPVLYKAIEQGYKQPAVIRGAMHMNILEEYLKNDGWKKNSEEWLTTSSFK